MSQKKKKKNRKLLVQLGHIMIPVFFVMFLVSVFSMYNSTVDGFLEAQDSHMTYLLEQTYEHSLWYDDKQLGWYLDKWTTYQQAMKEEATEAERSAYLDYYEDEDAWTLPWLEKVPEEVQIYCAKSEYTLVDGSISYDGELNKYAALFVIDLSEEHLGLVLFEYNRDTAAKQIGDNYSIDIKKHSAVRKMIETNSPETVFEKSYDIPQKGSYYIGYKPLIIDGKVRAALGIVYNWDEFQHTMIRTVRKAMIISVSGILLGMAILFIMLYRKAISPLSKIQKSVRDYINDKNSETVIAKMNWISERNEFGLHADNISELVREIDRYTEENIKLTGERERVAAELDMARNIQAAQLPSSFPAFPDRNEFDIYATMTPAKEVGGDFYDFFFVDDDHLALVMADVSGKGVPAALFMMMSKMLINNYTMMGLSPAEVLTRTNETICKNNNNKMFVTVWLGILEISTGKVTAANAGHEYPVIRQPDGRFELFKDKHGFVIGGIKNKKYKQYEFTLQKGGTIFVYTDGVPEATAANEDMFGTEMLVEVLNRDPGAAPQTLLKNVHEAVDSFVGQAPQFDDLTMLGITLLK